MEDFSNETLNPTDDSSASEYDAAYGADQGVVASDTANQSDLTANDLGEAEAASDVPFHQHPRWQEMLGERDAMKSELEQLKQWQPTIDMFKQSGVQSHAELQDYLFRQAQDAEAKREIEHYAQDQAQRLNQLVESGQIATELAQQIYQREVQAHQQLIDSRNMHARLTQQQQSIQFDGARAKYPEMDETAVRAVLGANPSADVMKLAEASHNRVIAAQERAIANYNASKAKDREIKAPEGRGGAAVPRRNAMPDPNSPEFDAWYREQLESTKRQYY